MPLAAEYDVVLLPTYAQVEAYRKRFASQNGAGLFSCVVSTFSAWIADLWELHGDGRRLVDGVQRRTIMQAACIQVYGEENLTPGLAQLAARCERHAAGLAAFEQALDQAECGEGPQGLHVEEQLFLKAIARYRALLDELDLVELGQACAALAQQADEVFPHPVRVLMTQAAPLTWMQRLFFDACPQVQLAFELAPGGEGVERMPEGVRMRFAFPAGRYAQPALIADVLRERGGEGPIVISCAHPLDMYKQLESALARVGVEACVQARVKFGQTDFGRTMLAMLRCVHEDAFDATALSDVIRSPFVGFAQRDALELDRQLRGDRIADRDVWLQELCQRSAEFSQLDDMARDPDASILLGAVEQRVMALPGRSQAWRTEQLAAIGGLRSVMETARFVDLPMKSCACVLETIDVVVSYAGALSQDGTAKPQVMITTQAVAATMDPGACTLLVLADLTSDDYPMSDRDDANSTLMAKLGFLPTDTTLARARRTFKALQQLPREEIMLVRPLNDYDANPTYPAVVLEELVDAYRSDPTDSADIDNLFRLPAALQQGMIQRGEETLYANELAACSDVRQPLAVTVEQPQLADMDGSDAGKVLLPRRTQDGGVLERFCPSPSQIESYLECPYRWFAERRLRPEQIDEQFGPLEKGTFAHEVLETFYRRFQESGCAKVDELNLKQAQDLMWDVFEELAHDQLTREPNSGRLVPLTQLEMWERSALRDNLVDFLEYEAQILPTFHPAYLEFEITPEWPVDYAGYQLVGKVDRIDVDDQGHAVIIDYKGSLDGEYDIAGKTPAHPGKVQTRIYAQAVKRALGLDVVGALYVSYGRIHQMHGAVGAILEAAHLPKMKLDNCRCGSKGIDEAVMVEPSELAYADFSFDAVLDLTEQRVAEAVEAMKNGGIAPMPAAASVCSYCKVPQCPKRGA